jgi:hypothetical protein
VRFCCWRPGSRRAALPPPVHPMGHVRGVIGRGPACSSTHGHAVRRRTAASHAQAAILHRPEPPPPPCMPAKREAAAREAPKCAYARYLAFPRTDCECWRPHVSPRALKTSGKWPCCREIIGLTVNAAHRQHADRPSASWPYQRIGAQMREPCAVPRTAPLAGMSGRISLKRSVRADVERRATRSLAGTVTEHRLDPITALVVSVVVVFRGGYRPSCRCRGSRGKPLDGNSFRGDLHS